jgi:hypothetical protein
VKGGVGSPVAVGSLPGRRAGLDRYGHLFPDELQQLADRLQDAYAQAVTDPARTEVSGAMLRERKGAGQRPAPAGGGGETRTLARLLEGSLVAAVLAA